MTPHWCRDVSNAPYPAHNFASRVAIEPKLSINIKNEMAWSASDNFSMKVGNLALGPLAMMESSIMALARTAKT
jgi:hypothetical protein